MKNLIKRIPLEELEKFPIGQISLKPTKEDRERSWRHRKNDWHPIKNIYPNKRAERLLEKYVGKCIDDAFTQFCKEVPKYQQHIFFREFDISQKWKVRGRYQAKYFIDSQRRIQKYKDDDYGGPYYFSSEDYKVELFHKDTGHPKEDFEVVRSEDYPYWKILGYDYGTKHPMKPINERYRAQKSDFVPIVVKGFQLRFKSKDNPLLQQLIQERRKLKKRAYKAAKKAQAKKAYSFISQTELQKKKDKERDLIKIMAHGFDPITSFRTEKQTNPDLIKNNQ